jgi:hypothetical protein
MSGLLPSPTIASSTRNDRLGSKAVFATTLLHVCFFSNEQTFARWAGRSGTCHNQTTAWVLLGTEKASGESVVWR